VLDVSDLDPLPPFPILMDEPAEPWRWPALPFDWRHAPPAEEDGARPCRIETPTGATVQGLMVKLDPAARSIDFRSAADAPPLALPFARMRRLTLTRPLRSVEQSGRLRAERVPLAAQERQYRLHQPDGSTVTGLTCGHVETEEGVFLYTRDGDDYALLREFVPRNAYTRCEVGPSALDVAAEKWIGTPRELLAAVERQRTMSIQPIGHSLLELGMVTREQLERALAQPHGDLPLGERMVELGVISKADLQTAIAHKMGYPFVDLTRFPIDLAAARKLPLRMAVTHRCLPILLDGQRLLVAMDRPVRMPRLQSLYALVGYTVIPVLASKGQILLALSGLAGQDLWQDRVSIQAEFFSTTR
jgi:hypothetical protein